MSRPKLEIKTVFFQQWSQTVPENVRQIKREGGQVEVSGPSYRMERTRPEFVAGSQGKAIRMRIDGQEHTFENGKPVESLEMDLTGNKAHSEVPEFAEVLYSDGETAIYRKGGAIYRGDRDEPLFYLNSAGFGAEQGPYIAGFDGETLLLEHARKVELEISGLEGQPPNRPWWVAAIEKYIHLRSDDQWRVCDWSGKILEEKTLTDENYAAELFPISSEMTDLTADADGHIYILATHNMGFGVIRVTVK